MPDVLIPIVAILGVFGVPIVAIWTSHERKMMEMRMRMRNEGDTHLKAAIEELQAEVRSLRDTTTQYDLSFDAALQRMESRVQGLERRLSEVEANTPANLRIGQ
ncbi:MAG TPA: hypothetical protein VFB38_24925 [Chthonomonadaceae bacterium]|nr:hypothetical protein [Chthonomonadaceae bacterium]